MSVQIAETLKQEPVSAANVASVSAALGLASNYSTVAYTLNESV